MNFDTELDEQGRRLKEERIRLRLTQEALAIACGVQRRTQIAYEGGTRSPDSGYLRAASSAGVDTQYVVFGLRNDHGGGEYWKQRDVLQLIAMVMNLNFSDELGEIVAHVSRITDEEDPSDIKKQSVVKAFLRKSPLFLDVEGLTSVICSVEEALSSLDAVFSPQKKAQIIIMAYRAFKASGKVDQEMIQGAIDLAAP